MSVDTRIAEWAATVEMERDAAIERAEKVWGLVREGDAKILRLVAEITGLEADLARVQAQAAEMRAALEVCKIRIGYRLTNESQLVGDLAAMEALDRALSTDAGRDYVHKSRVAEMKERCAKVAALAHRRACSGYAAVQAGLHDPGEGSVAAAIRALEDA